MKKVVLIDGNNLLFRSYFATSYTGNVMRNSKGFPTNALYGFVSMINKIIEEEKPEYLVVAFDIGKNFRKEKYDFYKDNRNATPDELKVQMPLARDILDALGIKHLELAPYEADDIIGTLAKSAESNKEYSSLIVSSDKDLLQLISFETDIKLLKQSGYIKYNEETFKKEWGIDPINIIDLKALMGDPSDNIPGVKGVGEKTALKLLQDYKTLDGIYEHIDEIKGKLKDKLLEGKNDAYMSYEIATIYRDVPIDINFDNYKYLGPNMDNLRKLYEELEFHSFLKNVPKPIEKKDNKYIAINSIDELDLDNDIAVYLEVSEENYNFGDILGMAITDKKNTYFIKKDLVIDTLNTIKDKNIYTYNAKKIMVKTNIDINCKLDLMIASYLVDLPANMDIYNIMTYYNEIIEPLDNLRKNNFEGIENTITLKSKFIFNYKDKLLDKIKENNEEDVLYNIEMPLIKVLASMEKSGFKFEEERLSNMKEEVKNKLDNISKEIYRLSGEEFNIASPKQLGEVLFEKLKIGSSKKTGRNYKTDSKTLQKYASKEPIINYILEYRNLNKLLNTYLDTLNDFVLKDGKIHTIFNQTLTRTGRLSSMDPNLQNIPTREEYGKNIRKAFLPSNDLILSADYSQIELRILAHISESKELMDAFINGEDIHTKVAADIHGIKESEVTKHMRSMAKAVIFGIVYGISGFGLGENLNISPKEANEFIEKYYELYPGVKVYMNKMIKEAYDNGYVKTMFGRMRVINELKDSNYMIRKMGERMAINTPIQGSSADIMKMAMIKVYESINEHKLESKMILQIHDEIVIDAKKEEVSILKSIIKDAMENVCKLRVPLKVEISEGTDWFEAK